MRRTIPGTGAMAAMAAMAVMVFLAALPAAAQMVEATGRAEEALVMADRKMAALESELELFRSQPLNPTEGVARPDLEAHRRKLALARETLESGQAPEAQELAQQVWLEARLDILALQDLVKGRSALDEARTHLDLLRSQAPEQAGRLDEAALALTRAAELHRHGDPSYWQPLDEVNGTFDRIEADLRRTRQLGYFLWFLRLVIAILLLASLLALVRRLRDRLLPEKEKAESLLASCQTTLDRRPEALIEELGKRADAILAPAASEGRLYRGDTAALAAQIRSDLDSSSRLSANARAVLEQARKEIRPRRLDAVFHNLFFPGRYRRGIELLRNEPALRDPSKLTQELEALAARSDEALDRMEEALAGAGPLLASARARVREMEIQQPFVESADGLFRVPSVFSALLPAARSALDEAGKTLAADPVATLHGSAARARRLTDEAGQLLAIARNARETLLPALDTAAGALDRSGIATGWIAAGRRTLSDRAEEIAVRAVSEDAGSAAEELAADLAAFQGQAERAVELAGQVAAVRASLAARPADTAIAGRIAAAEAALGTGDIDSAAEALEAATPAAR